MGETRKHGKRVKSSLQCLETQEQEEKAPMSYRVILCELTLSLRGQRKTGWHSSQCALCLRRVFFLLGNKFSSSIANTQVIQWNGAEHWSFSFCSQVEQRDLTKKKSEVRWYIILFFTVAIYLTRWNVMKKGHFSLIVWEAVEGEAWL